jgi:hypothetical protein
VHVHDRQDRDWGERPVFHKPGKRVKEAARALALASDLTIDV